MASEPSFAIWITGLPASGKSTLATALQEQLAARGVKAEVLESDQLREVFTPHPRFDEDERANFYRQLVFLGTLLMKHGVPVIFDATANRREYRDHARRNLGRFLEVYVDTPLATCMSRDPKGIYKRAQAGLADSVPGLQVEYEAPAQPDVVVRGGEESPHHAAERVISELQAHNYLPAES